MVVNRLRSLSLGFLSDVAVHWHELNWEGMQDQSMVLPEGGRRKQSLQERQPSKNPKTICPLQVA